MNLKLIFFPLAVVVEVASVVVSGRETGFGNWVMDRELGDPTGKPWQSREEALKEHGISTH